MSKVDLLVNHIRKTLDLDAPLSDDETYWYSSLGLCVIDAVYSIGVRYESTRRTVSDFCRWAHWEEDLAKAPREYTVGEFVGLLEPYNGKWQEMADEVFHNRQRTSTRGGILKAEAVFKFAKVLKQFGIEKYADIPASGPNHSVAAAIQNITGQGSGLSYKYFLMLTGNRREVKGDRMVTRFVGEAVGDPLISGDEAEDLVRAAAAVLQAEHPKLTATSLDYLIWKYQRDQQEGSEQLLASSAQLGQQVATESAVPSTRDLDRRGIGIGDDAMTYEQVAELFSKYEKASTWPSTNPQKFYFWVGGRTDERSAYLYQDNGRARYLWVPIEEVIEHVEPTGQTDTYNIYYRLKKRR